MPGKRKRLSNVSPMPAYYTNTGGYNLPAVEIRGRAPQWAKEQNYYDQLANFYADRFDVNGNNSRLPEIIGRAKANPEFWNEDGSLNQKGNAYITQQKHFGVGSNYYNRMNEYAKQTAYGLAQVAGAPYLAGLTGRQLLGSTIGGTIGSIEGSEIGRRFDNPETGNYAGSELGALLGGLAGGAIGGNVKPLFRKYIKGMTKLDQAQTRYWDRKELNQLLKNPQITSENNIGYEVNPTIRTKIGDVEIDNPGLYYHQSAAGKAKNFVSTGRMRTPLEEYWLAKEEAGEHIPIAMRVGIEPGYPQSPGSAMFAKGNLWYGLDPNKPDLLVTAKEMPIANRHASIMSKKASLKKLEAQGPRRVTNDNIYIQGPHNRQNTAAYIWEPDYGYRKVISRTDPRTSFRFLERPNKLTYAEKAGFPKGQSRLENDPEVFKNARAFAKKYKYDIPVTIDGIKNMYRRHNRFFRTIKLNEYPENDVFFDNVTNKNVYPELKGLTNKEATMLLASKGYPLYYRTGYKGDLGKGFADDFVFVSPNLAENKGYQINGLDQTVMLQRPFSFGSPNKWHLNADYNVSDIPSGTYTKGKVGFGNAAPIHEVKLATDKLIPVKIAEENDLGSNIGIKYKTNNSIDDWTDWNDYETGNLSDIIFHRKYGGRTQFANGGGPYYIKNYVTPGETLESRRRQRKQKERYIDKKAENILYALSLNAKANDFINLNRQSKQNVKSTQTNNTTNTSISQYNWGQGRKPFYDSSNKLTSNSFAKPLNSTSQTKNKTINKQSITTNTTHTVKSGDSPWQIARDNGMTLNTFYKLNPSARNGIYPGDVVNVNKSANIHKVKSGDSPWQIAKDNNISLDELYRLNPEARKMIYPGDELILPDKTRNKKRYGGSLRRRLESGGYLSY